MRLLLHERAYARVRAAIDAHGPSVEPLLLDDTGAVVGDLDEAVAITIRATRRFVRRQRSWFRRDPRVHWLDAADPDLVESARRFVPLTL